MELNREVAQKVLQTVDAGLSHGVGRPEPGEMCVEAAVCYALGLPHGDDPGCVSPALRRLKIRLNDSGWSSNEARAKGLRRLALAQLGSKDVLNDAAFVKAVAEMSIRKMVPRALRSAAFVQKSDKHKDRLVNAALRCETEGTKEAAQDALQVDRDAAAAAYAAVAAAAYAAAAADVAAAAAADAAAAVDADAAKKRDEELSFFAEEVVQILIRMNAPGCQWLDLTEAA